MEWDMTYPRREHSLLSYNFCAPYTKKCIFEKTSMVFADASVEAHGFMP